MYSLYLSAPTSVVVAYKFQILLLCLEAALANCLMDVRRKLVLENDVVVQRVFEVLGAAAAAMAIVDSKDLKLWPKLGRDSRLFLGRLDHVEYD